jgi:hypothetical protein
LAEEEKCELCFLSKITHWYFETDDFVVCDCKLCKVPMYVWKKHNFPTEKQRQEMLSHAFENFPNYRIDGKRRKIPEHFHFHCRKNKID